MNNLAKNAKVRELFESQQLVQYPDDSSNGKSTFFMVDHEELHLIQEMNESTYVDQD